MESLHHRLDWLRRTFKKVSIVEIVIVVIVLVILLLAVFPSFKRAQIMAGVTKTKQSLSLLTNAVISYNCKNTKKELAWTVFFHEKQNINVSSSIMDRDKESTEPNIQYEILEFSLFGLAQDSVHPINTTVINPSSRNTENLFVNQYIDTRYPGVGYHIFSNSVDWEFFTRIGPAALTYSSPPFSNLSYRGITTGPINIKAIDSGRVKLNVPLRDKIILYDPTNGTLSHGYLIYEATPARSSLSSATNTIQGTQTP